MCSRLQREDLSLHQFKVEEITTQIQELVARVKKDQQLWLKQQLVLVMLTQKTEAKRKEMSKLQTEYISMQQKKIRLESMNYMNAHTCTRTEGKQFSCETQMKYSSRLKNL